MGSGLKFLFPRTLFLAFVVLIIGEGILVLVCVALKWHSIDTFNFQNNLNFPRLFTSQKYWLHFIMFRMCWRTWGAEIIEWFTVLLQQPWEVLFWLWRCVLTSKFKSLFFSSKKSENPGLLLKRSRPSTWRLDLPSNKLLTWYHL